MHQLLLLMRAGFSRGDLMEMPARETRVFLDALEAREEIRYDALRKHAKSAMPVFNLSDW